MSIQATYATIKVGGRQEKASVGDVVIVDKLAGKIDDEVALTPVVLVGDDRMITSTVDLAKSSVTVEIIGDEKDPKIDILKFKNKTSFRGRQGHRAQLTAVKVTAIE